jgi:hypothetical protein
LFDFLSFFPFPFFLRQDVLRRSLLLHRLFTGEERERMRRFFASHPIAIDLYGFRIDYSIFYQVIPTVLLALIPAFYKQIVKSL